MWSNQYSGILTTSFFVLQFYSQFLCRLSGEIRIGKQGVTNSNHIYLPLTDNPIGIFRLCNVPHPDDRDFYRFELKVLGDRHCSLSGHIFSRLLIRYSVGSYRGRRLTRVL